MDETVAFLRASEGFLQLAGKIDPSQWSDATPCAEWDVRALVNHVAGEYLWVPEMLAGRTIAEVGDRLAGDVLGDAPLDSLRQARRAAADALEPAAALDTTVHLSFGDMPAAGYVKQMAIDSTIHSWDLATGIGADTMLDPQLVAISYAELQTSAEDWRAGGAFGPARDATDDSTQAKLLALTGR